MSEEQSPELTFGDQGDPLTAENYAFEAEDVLATFVDKPGQYIPGGYDKAFEAYVKEAEQPGLARLAEAILEAPNALKLQAALGRAQESGDRSKIETYLPTVLRYNHLLRDLIAETPAGMFTRDQLSGWLTEASNDRTGEWVDQLLTGIVGEVAVAKRLRTIPRVAEVRLASDTEDRQGMDIVAELQTGGQRRIDVKCGRHRLDQEVTVRRNGVVEVAIDPSEIKGFGIAKEHRPDVTARLEHALNVGW